MTKPVLMGTWHKALTDSLSSLSWVKNVADYPEQVTKLTTPAVFVDVAGWQQADSSDGQVNVVLQCDLFVVVDRTGQSAEKPEVYARALAMDLTQWLSGADFGIEEAYPAEFLDAVRDEFDQRLADYIVFRVSFSQQLPVGEPFFADPEGAPLQRVYLGVAPDIGRAHEEDYRLIWESKDSGDEQ
ncbi:hypothetical protein GTGU_00173 [Trabulsiella guamensis ATCC 49490]|uniref:Phage protein n=1 Tax=Trabulsiella guamensis ATCC 49490 TaxID=1005994 RepID=A0A085ASD6_9ENTR|nr:hypothetical protein [Trabulsiella guamensis]KFC13131.1 hypothetical protein GTGU_00173 [Trabulsiella guamensis ATCC 49490]